MAYWVEIQGIFYDRFPVVGPVHILQIAFIILIRYSLRGAVSQIVEQFLLQLVLGKNRLFDEQHILHPIL